MIFFPEAYQLADFCPLASSSMAPSVGPREPSGAGLGMFSGSGAHELRTSRLISPLSSHPHSIALCPTGQGGASKQPFPPQGQELPPRLPKPDVPHPSGSSVTEQSGEGAGRDSPRGPEQPSDAGWACCRARALAWRVGKNDFSWDPFPFLSSGSQERWTGDRPGSFCRGRASSALNFP